MRRQGNDFGRYIPAAVREKLRKEVNFGCPINGCGVPYLTSHHFDPPFSELVRQENPQHDPAGIIALCHTHADHADGGMWTPQQLRELKRTPFVTADARASRFDFLRGQLVIRMGVVTTGSLELLRILDELVIGLERDAEGYLRLNLRIRDRDKLLILEMNRNDWTIFTDRIADLSCTPQGKELAVKSTDRETDFKIRFDNLTLAELRKKLEGFPDNGVGLLEKRLTPEKSASLLTITGRIRWTSHEVKLTEDSFSVSGPRLSYQLRTSVMIGAETRTLYSCTDNQVTLFAPTARP